MHVQKLYQMAYVAELGAQTEQFGTGFEQRHDVGLRSAVRWQGHGVRDGRERDAVGRSRFGGRHGHGFMGRN